MKVMKLHTKADSYGVVHLQLPVAPPNSEVDLELVVTRAEPPAQTPSLSLCDRRLFAFVLGDRVYSRRQPVSIRRHARQA
ncbi:MAG TPA: hypothetical protein VN633_22615 [Bryobacteraceae bacterium]|nr:hypothetical protein [Bryobacteraceae bacterium]